MSAGDTTVEQPRPEIERPPHSMLQDAVTYRPVPDRVHSAFARSGGSIPAAPPGQEAEFADHVATSITIRRSTIASGEKLLRDPSKLHAVRRLHGKVEVGEMEAAGFVAACRTRAVPWMVIRGISDFGDELKDDRFHELAACAASAVLPSPPPASVGYLLAETVHRLPGASFERKEPLSSVLDALARVRDRLPPGWTAQFGEVPGEGSVSVRDVVMLTLSEQDPAISLKRAGILADHGVTLPHLAHAVFRQQHAVHLALEGT